MGIRLFCRWHIKTGKANKRQPPKILKEHNFIPRRGRQGWSVWDLITIQVQAPFSEIYILLLRWDDKELWASLPASFSVHFLVSCDEGGLQGRSEKWYAGSLKICVDKAFSLCQSIWSLTSNGRMNERCRRRRLSDLTKQPVRNDSLSWSLAEAIAATRAVLPPPTQPLETILFWAAASAGLCPVQAVGRLAGRWSSIPSRLPQLTKETCREESLCVRL